MAEGARPIDHDKAIAMVASSLESLRGKSTPHSDFVPDADRCTWPGHPAQGREKTRLAPTARRLRRPGAIRRVWRSWGSRPGLTRIPEMLLAGPRGCGAQAFFLRLGNLRRTVPVAQANAPNPWFARNFGGRHVPRFNARGRRAHEQPAGLDDRSPTRAANWHGRGSRGEAVRGAVLQLARRGNPAAAGRRCIKNAPPVSGQRQRLFLIRA